MKNPNFHLPESTILNFLALVILLSLVGISDHSGELNAQQLYAPDDPSPIVTPEAGPAPKINGPTVYGCRPDNPFIYRIPCTGTRPIQFSAQGLPGSLQLDAAKGIITGTNPDRGTYIVTLKAKNGSGSDSRKFKIVSGDKLALTPPMGWNHWYAHYDRITDAMMREAADIMVSSGMADVGYQYVNIDDCWMNAKENKDRDRVGPLRDQNENILPNRHFPNMRALTSHIHGYGLKAGLYTSPGPFTCARFAGTYLHEEQDARRFADWGFDFLKYDWCSYGGIAPRNPSVGDLMAPYAYMGDILKNIDRDIVLNLCQYGMGDVWKWGAEVGGQSWRTGGDLGFELDKIFDVALKNIAIREYNKPGEWNDPDYIQIGWIGNATGMGKPQPCPISPNMQYSYMSLWSLMAAPLFYSGDMTQLDEFTLNILCNVEVIEVNQDPIGECAEVIDQENNAIVLVKKLIDGSRAIGMFNRSDQAREVTVNWNSLKIEGTKKVRDLWRQKDIGSYDASFSALVPEKGVIMIRVYDK